MTSSTAITDNAVPLADVLNRIDARRPGQGVARRTSRPIAPGAGAHHDGRGARLPGQGDRHRDGRRRPTPASARWGWPWTATTGPSRCGSTWARASPSDESSIRDAAGFITFGDFKDQTEYGKVGSEINKRVVADLEAAGCRGQGGAGAAGQAGDASRGAFTMRTFNQPQIDVSTITLVPVELAAQ